MTKKDIIGLFENIHAYRKNNTVFLHKPLIVLIALGFCYKKRERLIEFSEFDTQLLRLFGKFYSTGLESKNTHYPFGKLENDKIWEIEDSKNLKRTSVGHLFRGELIERRIKGGFISSIYDYLISDQNNIIEIAQVLAGNFLAEFDVQSVLMSVGLIEGSKMGIVSKISEQDTKYNVTKKDVIYKYNDYISYLNSLHNLTASNSNSLAESQALNPYFSNIYQPFPIVTALFNALTDGTPRVILLSGHAGDGKSTIALDLFKRLRQLPPEQPLTTPLREREEIEHSSGRVVLVKDMSELSGEQRLESIRQSFTESGSWLVVSNTGPLLNTIESYAHELGASSCETELLTRLDQPINGDEFQYEHHTLTLFSKPLMVINLARLDNVELASEILRKMLNHPGWSGCRGCPIDLRCPIHTHRQILVQQIKITLSRVQWCYQRLNYYDQRLTLRQMVAHLALALTGGRHCRALHHDLGTTNDPNDERALDALESGLFSETFFGLKGGEPWAEALTLKAVAQVHKLGVGAPVAVDMDRKLLANGATSWVALPPTLQRLQQRWRQRGNEPAGVRWRFALRRMVYLFGQSTTTTSELKSSANTFYLNQIQSPMFVWFELCRRSRQLEGKPQQLNGFRLDCLNVLLELYSGFSSGQFRQQRGEEGRLYLTLRRADRSVIQPTQLIMAELPFSAFTLEYDSDQRQPQLRFGQVNLPLSLPLLDYIRSRVEGVIGVTLTPTHQAQIDRFRAELLQVAQPIPSGTLHLLRAGIDGVVKSYRYQLSADQHRLEYLA